MMSLYKKTQRNKKQVKHSHRHFFTGLFLQWPLPFPTGKYPDAKPLGFTFLQLVRPPTGTGFSNILN
jgi:hypothetical protein